MPRRNSRGRFVKSGRKSTTRRRRSSSGVSLVVRENVSLTAPRRRSPVRRRAAAPARRRRRYSGGGGRTTIVGSIKSKLPQMAGSAVYGFITQGKSSTATKVKSYLDMVPTISAIGAPASHGLLFTAIACYTSGRTRRYADLLASAALNRFAYNIGSADFSFASGAAMSGDGDTDMRGTIGDEDLTDY